MAVTANVDSCDLSRIDVSPGGARRGHLDVPGRSAERHGDDPLRSRPGRQPAAADGAVGQRRSQDPLLAPGLDRDGARQRFRRASPRSTATTPAARPASAPAARHNAWVALPGCQLVVKVNLRSAPRSSERSDQAAPGDDRQGAARRRQRRHRGARRRPVDDRVPRRVRRRVRLGRRQRRWRAAGAGADGHGRRQPAVDASVAGDARHRHRSRRLGRGQGRPPRHRRRLRRAHRHHSVRHRRRHASASRVSVHARAAATTVCSQPGVQVVRVGPRSQAGKFLYAVARDGTVRVIDLDRNVECETNPDPRWKTPTIDLQETPTLNSSTSQWSFPAPPPRALGCFPLGDASTPPRSPFVELARHHAAARARSRPTSRSCTCRCRRATSDADHGAGAGETRTARRRLRVDHRRATARARSSTSTTPARSRTSRR